MRTANHQLSAEADLVLLTRELGRAGSALPCSLSHIHPGTSDKRADKHDGPMAAPCAFQWARGLDVRENFWGPVSALERQVSHCQGRFQTPVTF